MEHKNRRMLFKRIGAIAMTHPGWMVMAIVLSVISAVSYFVPYLVIYRILQVLIRKIADYENTMSVEIFRLGAAGAAGAAVNVAAYFAALVSSHVAAFDTSFDLKISFANKLSELPLGFYVENASGKLRGVMDNNIGQIQSFLAHKIPDLVASVVYPAVMVWIILRYNPGLGAAVILGIAAAYIFHYRSMGRGGVKNMMELYLDALDVMNEASVEYVRGITVIKLFGSRGNAAGNLVRSIHDYIGMTIPYTREWEKYMCWFEMLINHIFIFLLPAGAFFMMKAENYTDFASDFIFYLILAPSVAYVIPKIGGIMNEGMRLSGALERFDSVMDQKSMNSGREAFPSDSHQLAFENVFFRYSQDKEKEAVSDISFICPENSVTALVGYSGSGKSTLIHLAARFWDVDSGKITIGGVNIKDIRYEELMKNISFVFQDDYLFHQSVWDNICLENKNASEEEIYAAARLARCHDWIMRLPSGYRTVIGEDGIILSGGEKQRILIARAIFKNTPILILDEVTAAQDAENECYIQQGLKELMKGKTVLMIAHRLSSIKDADQIVVLKDGKICDRGIHEELIAKDGIYHNMWQAFEKAFSWKIKTGGKKR